MYQFSKRTLDIMLVALATPILLPVAVLVAVAVRVTSSGPALYWSERVGCDEKLFSMPKFRTMRAGTPALATHLMADPSAVYTPIGAFLRKTSLDEIPQLWSVLRGDMSFVGPRPALFNQDDLIALRRETGVAKIAPGITGLAQIRGRDDLQIAEKAAYDAEYFSRRSFVFDLSILFETVVCVIRGKGVSH